MYIVLAWQVSIMKNISLYLSKKRNVKNTPIHSSVEHGPFLLIHLLKRIRDIKRTDLLIILKLEKLVPAVSGHVHKDIRPVVRQQAFGARDGGIHAAGEDAEKVFDSDFVPAVVDLDVGAVEVEGSAGVGVDAAGEFVAGVAGDVVGEHEDDVGVGDAEAFDGAVPVWVC